MLLFWSTTLFEVLDPTLSQTAACSLIPASKDHVTMPRLLFPVSRDPAKRMEEVDGSSTEP